MTGLRHGWRLWCGPVRMIETLDPRDRVVAGEVHALQQASYEIERQLLGLASFFPLGVRVEDIQAEPDTFLGWRESGRLVGVVSYLISPSGLYGDEAPRPMMDIGRMIVHPEFFRRGIAATLLAAAEAAAPRGARITVSTGEANGPAVRLYETRGYRAWRRTTLPDGLRLVRFLKEVGA